MPLVSEKLQNSAVFAGFPDRFAWKFMLVPLQVPPSPPPPQPRLLFSEEAEGQPWNVAVSSYRQLHDLH